MKFFRADRNYDFEGCLMMQKREFCGTWWSGFSFLFLWTFKVIIVPHCLIEVLRKIIYFLPCVILECNFRKCLNMVWFCRIYWIMSEFGLILIEIKICHLYFVLSTVIFLVYMLLYQNFHSITKYLFGVLWIWMLIGVNSLILDTACYLVCPHLAFVSFGSAT